MAIKYYDKYPQRWESPSNDYPQGAFKNLSAIGENDGSYLEKDWLNDQSGFFGALLRNAEMTPNGLVDTAQQSQFYDALLAVANKNTEAYFSTRSIGTGKVIREGAAKKDFLNDAGLYTPSITSVASLKAGDNGVSIASNLDVNNAGLNLQSIFTSPRSFVYYETQSTYSEEDTRAVFYGLREPTVATAYRRNADQQWSVPSVFLTSSNTRADKNNVLHSGTSTPIDTLNTSDLTDHVQAGLNQPVTSSGVYGALQVKRNLNNQLFNGVQGLNLRRDGVSTNNGAEIRADSPIDNYNFAIVHIKDQNAIGRHLFEANEFGTVATREWARANIGGGSGGGDGGTILGQGVWTRWENGSTDEVAYKNATRQIPLNAVAGKVEYDSNAQGKTCRIIYYPITRF